MKISKQYALKWLITSMTISFLLISCNKETYEEYDDYLYQYSIIDALLAGVYDGNLTIGELKPKGDFGIGSFNQVDGELLMMDGVVYKIRYDGSVQIVPDKDKTSIAFVKSFKSDTIFTIERAEKLSFEQLTSLLETKLNKNEIYAIRLSGTFTDMHTRAPAPAKKPYIPLAEHLKTNQYEFNLGTTTGIAVGFYSPPYAESINIPGFHFHYISDDKKSGGHILDFSVTDLKIEVDKASGLIVETIDSKDFMQADLEKNRQNEVEQVERGKIDTIQ